MWIQSYMRNNMHNHLCYKNQILSYTDEGGTLMKSIIYSGVAVLMLKNVIKLIVSLLRRAALMGLIH